MEKFISFMNKVKLHFINARLLILIFYIGTFWGLVNSMSNVSICVTEPGYCNDFINGEYFPRGSVLTWLPLGLAILGVIFAGNGIKRYTSLHLNKKEYATTLLVFVLIFSFAMHAINLGILELESYIYNQNGYILQRYTYIYSTLIPEYNAFFNYIMGSLTIALNITFFASIGIIFKALFDKYAIYFVIAVFLFGSFIAAIIGNILDIINALVNFANIFEYIQDGIIWFFDLDKAFITAPLSVMLVLVLLTFSQRKALKYTRL